MDNFVCTGILCSALECDLSAQWCDKKKSEVALVRPAIKKKKKVSATLKVSLWFNNRHTLGPYRGLYQSEIVKGAPPSDWPWSRYSCTCVYV